MAKSNRFYLACYRDNVGSQVSFHCRDSAGYSTNLAKAHVYNIEYSQYLLEHCREFEEPLCADRVDALSEWHVDHQYIPAETTTARPGAFYAGFKARCFDGNDVFWLRNNGLPTTNFELASFTHDPDLTDNSVIWIPALVATQAARRVIKMDAINRRSMLTAAGLRIPESRKKRQAKARRKTSGKTRWNCPGCGRVVWQYNPHDFNGCSNISCSEWRAPWKMQESI